MKIAYLVDVDLDKESGVSKKIEMQTKIWKQNNHEVLLVSTKSLVVHKSTFLNYINKVKSSRTIKKKVSGFSPDVIYYRQGIWYPGLLHILRLAPVVMEINTNDLVEIKTEAVARRIIYKFGRSLILRKVKGLITVSRDLNALFPKHKVITIGNGYIFPQNQKIKAHSISYRPQILFVGSPNCSWHGVDKIVHLAEKLNEFDYHIVGIDDIAKKLDNITLHGYLSAKELEKIYAFADVAFGSLSMYKAGFTESSTLKVREYLVNGLPVILGGHDVDFKNVEFILELPNTEDNTDPFQEEIKEFVWKWKGKRVPQELVFDQLDYQNKEEKRLKFFKEIIEN